MSRPTNKTLILKQISKEQSGWYSCEAKNKIAKTTSNQLYIQVKCEFNTPRPFFTKGKKN